MLKESAQEKLIARDVPEEDGSPNVEVAPMRCKQRKRAVSAGWIEPTVDHLGHVAKPHGTPRSNEVLRSSRLLPPRAAALDGGVRGQIGTVT